MNFFCHQFTNFFWILIFVLLVLKMPFFIREFVANIKSHEFTNLPLYVTVLFIDVENDASFLFVAQNFI